MLVSDIDISVNKCSSLVLILVLVDVGLGLFIIKELKAQESSRLNPCFSGCWSRTYQYRCKLQRSQKCLNPCFSGCWSRTRLNFVLIFSRLNVLILVLVDVGLGLRTDFEGGRKLPSLNPCFSGCWSRTDGEKFTVHFANGES